MEFREALNYGATGASEFNDVLGAGVYLRNRADVDPQRIGLWGGSYGGYFLNFSDWLRAYHAAADFFDRHLKRQEAGAGSGRQVGLERAWERGHLVRTSQLGFTHGTQFKHKSHGGGNHVRGEFG
jgi:hypothetical protein